MIKISTISILGFLIALTPYSGFPMEWKNFIYIFSGLAVAVLAYLIRRELHEVLKRLHTSTDVNATIFVETEK